MNQTRFRLLIAHVLAGAALTANGCGESDTDMPERAVCIDPKSDTRYTTLTLGPNVDGIAFATRTFTSSPGTSSSTPVTTNLPSLGAPCSKGHGPSGLRGHREPLPSLG